MKVGIVIVTFNRLNLLKEVIESLRLQTYKNYQLIVVNNGSTDNTFQWLSEQKDIYIINQENTGGAGGFFTGMKYVAENQFDYCWIMDDDVICESNALEELIKAYQVKDNIGFVCSRVIGIDGRPMNTPAADTRPTDNGYADLFDLVERHSMVKVKMATFVSIFLGTEKIKELGLPIKEYFIWGDDSEYTERISSKYPCYIACRSLVVHKRTIQKSLKFEEETDPKRLYNYFYLFRNHAYTLKLNNKKKEFWNLILKLPFKLLKLLLQLKTKQAKILIKSYTALLFFNPHIYFPKK